MKVCFKCKQTKPRSDFYKHPQMGDGLLGKCKQCARADVVQNRLANIEYYRGFDKDRASLPHRVAARKAYSTMPSGKEAHLRAHKKHKALFPKKAQARYAVANAVRDGRLEKLPCLICGDKSEAHHTDYDAPLDVVWLCPTHHKQAHAMARKAA